MQRVLPEPGSEATPGEQVGKATNRLPGQRTPSISERFSNARHRARLYRQRLGRLAQPLLFLAVGGSGMLVDLLMLTVFLTWIDFRPARALAIAIAMTWNFNLNRRFTFVGARSGPLLRQYVLFCLSCGVGAIVNWNISTWLWLRWSSVLRFPAVAAMAGIAAGVLLNYALSARLVFRSTAGNRSLDHRTLIEPNRTSE